MIIWKVRLDSSTERHLNLAFSTDPSYGIAHLFEALLRGGFNSIQLFDRESVFTQKWHYGTNLENSTIINTSPWQGTGYILNVIGIDLI